MRIVKGFQKGVNLGGWLSQGILDKEHLDSFITEADITKIASWGADHVRLPLDYENIENEDGSVRESGYFYIDSCISWCRKNGLNIVLDLHKTYGYIFDDPEYSKDFFHSSELQKRFLNTWTNIISRYAKDSDIMMVELLNEVVPNDVVSEWNELALRAINVIRSVSEDIKILYGGVGYNAVTSIKKLMPPVDENIVYNFHCYEPLVFTHQTAWWVDDMPKDFHIDYPGSIDDYMEKSRSIKGTMHGALSDENVHVTCLGPDFFEEIFRDGIEAGRTLNVPLYCGEYGVIDQAPAEATVRWFKDINSVFRKYGIGRAVWNYKEKDFGIVGEHYDSVRDELIDSIFGE